METPDLAPVSHWKNALSRLRQWIQSDAAADVVRVTDADEPEARSASPSPSKRFRQSVKLHRAHPREEHPDQNRADHPEAPSPPNVSAGDRYEEHRAAHDSLGSGLAQRMLSTALGADPEERDEEDREFGMHIIVDEGDTSDDEEAPALDSRELQGPRPITHH